MLARALVAIALVSVCGACGAASRGPLDPQTADDLDRVLADSTYAGGVDVSRALAAPVVARFRGVIDRQLRAAEADWPPACRLDVLGSLRTIVIGARDGGSAGALIAHGVATAPVRTCLTDAIHVPVAVERDNVYRIAIAQSELEIRLVDGDTVWLRWGPAGTLREPASAPSDAHDLRALLARVDRSATAWVVSRPTATELRDLWSTDEMPPPVAIAASVRLTDAIGVDALYATASSASARRASDALTAQLSIAHAMFRLDLSVHADGSELWFHGSATADTVAKLLELAGAAD